MAKEAEKVETDVMSFVDSVLGGASHSPKTEEPGIQNTVETDPPADDDLPFGEDNSDDGIFEDDEPDAEAKKKADEESADKKKEQPAADSGKEEASRAEELNREAEIEKLNKRLKDTQAAFHKTAAERADLKKELEALKVKKNDEDDWFSEEDKTRAAVLESKIKANETEHAETSAQAAALEQQTAIALWDVAAFKVKAEHEDFEEVVYNVLAPMLNPDGTEYDAVIKSEYERLKDKSPASAYAFAKKVADQREFLKDPEAYKAKIRNESKTNNQKTATATKLTGKAGLDLLNSESAPSGNKESPRGFVSSVFK